MRIITGRKKGTKLLYPETESCRPTTDRVKENIYNLLSLDYKGKTVLDLFAGSGGMGLEAVSRGADLCFFVDNGKEACDIIGKNIRKLDFGVCTKVFKGDYVDFLKTAKCKFDLVFLDPPYHCTLVDKSLKMLKANRLLNDNAVIVIETDFDEDPDIEGFEIIKQAKYGRVLVRILTERK